MTKVQIAVLITGSIFFLWFAIPMLVKGIINIGNITGMVIFGLLLLYGIFQRRVNACMICLWDSNAGSVVWLIAIALVVVLDVTATAETIWMIKAATNRPPEGTHAVVLGCAVKGDKPSRILRERLEAAYDYLSENEETVCILSGGQGEGEEISEAECMYRYLTEKGIAAERLLMETASTNTEENLLYSRALMQAYGLGNEVTIVTSEFHAYRADDMAKKLGLKSYSTPSHTSLWYLPTYYVRELYGILYYKLRK